MSDLNLDDVIEFYGVVQDERTIRESYQTHYTLFAPADKTKQVDFGMYFFWFKHLFKLLTIPFFRF